MKGHHFAYRTHIGTIMQNESSANILTHIPVSMRQSPPGLNLGLGQSCFPVGRHLPGRWVCLQQNFGLPG